MILKIDAKFQGKLTRAFKNDMRNVTNFDKFSQAEKQPFHLRK